MKDIFVSNLKTGDEITTYLMVKAAVLRMGSNRKTFLDLVLGDSSGEISGKKWDIADEEIPGLERIKEGSIIKVFCCSAGPDSHRAAVERFIILNKF